MSKRTLMPVVTHVVDGIAIDNDTGAVVDTSAGALIKTLAETCKQHIGPQRGKKADEIALHYFAGVCHALHALNDPRTESLNAFTMYLVATRGYKAVLSALE